MIKKPEDFEVLDCVGHHYEDDRNRWLWHCITCDCGSLKNWGRRHNRGHQTPGRAAEGFLDHQRTMRMQRQYELYNAWWWQTVLTTKNVEVFRRLWLTHHGKDIEADRVTEIMGTVQSDERLRATYLGIAE